MVLASVTRLDNSVTLCLRQQPECNVQRKHSKDIGDERAHDSGTGFKVLEAGANEGLCWSLNCALASYVALKASIATCFAPNN